jgi:hypothetical protein
LTNVPCSNKDLASSSSTSTASRWRTVVPPADGASDTESAGPTYLIFMRTYLRSEWMSLRVLGCRSG